MKDRNEIYKVVSEILVSMFEIEEDDWGISQSTDSLATIDLGISGMVVQNELQITFNFHADRLSSDRISKLTSAYQKSLKNLIQYCNDFEGLPS